MSPRSEGYYFSSIYGSHVWRRCRSSLALVAGSMPFSPSSLNSCISESHVITVHHTHCSSLSSSAHVCSLPCSQRWDVLTFSSQASSHFLSQQALLSISLSKQNSLELPHPFPHLPFSTQSALLSGKQMSSPNSCGSPPCARTSHTHPLSPAPEHC